MTLENYFFANKNSHWLIVALSFLAPTIFIPFGFDLLFANNEFLIPLFFGMTSFVILLLLGSKILPRFLDENINTLPEFFEKRFDKTCRYFFAVLYVFSNIFLRLVIILIAGNYFISLITGTNAYFTILFLLIISSIYLIVGGLKAENYVNLIQVAIVTIVFVVLSIWLLSGNNEFVNSANNNSAEVIQSISSKLNLSLTEVLLGIPILSFWFWCGDQIIIQKAFGIKKNSSAKRAPVFAGVAQIIPIIVVVLPLIIFIAPALSGSEISYSVLSILNYSKMPMLIKEGLVLAIASILLASFTSTFNSTSLLITFDFYKNIKKRASDEELVLIGRMLIMGLLLIAIILLSTTKEFSLYDSLLFLKPFTYFIALSSVIILVGVFNNTIKSASGLITISIGTVIIISRTIFDVFANNYPFENILLKWFASSGFLEFSIFIFLFSIILLFFFQKFLKSEKNVNGYNEKEITKSENNYSIKI